LLLDHDPLARGDRLKLQENVISLNKRLFSKTFCAPLKTIFTNSPLIDILGENKDREMGRRPAI